MVVKSHQCTCRDLVILIIGMILGILLINEPYYLKYNHKFINVSKNTKTSQQSKSSFDDIVVPMEAFPEPAWRTKSTLAVKTIASTPFARFEIHKVKTESGAIVNDWLWTDERSHVNILVHLKQENKYLLFKQKKYGLEKEYYAVIGGLFNVNESSTECAQRELMEETGLEAEELVSLGRYRVQVNRGGGILYAYLARNCVPSKIKKISDDYEKQNWVKLSYDELLKIALAGEVGEAQWVAAVALGLLFDRNNKSVSVG